MTKASAFMLYASCGIRFFLAGYAPCVHAIALDKDDGTIHKTGQPACLLEKSEGLARMFFLSVKSSAFCSSTAQPIDTAFQMDQNDVLPQYKQRQSACSAFSRIFPSIKEQFRILSLNVQEGVYFRCHDMFVATGSVSREFVLNKKGKTMSAEQISAWIKTLAPKIGADLIAESPDNFVLAFLGAIHCKIRYSTPDDRLYFFAPLEIPGLDSATIDPNLLLEANHLAVGLGGMAFYRTPETGDIILAQSFSMRFLDAKEFFMALKGFLFSARALWEFVIQAMENLNNGDSFLSDEDGFKKTAAWQRANC